MEENEIKTRLLELLTSDTKIRLEGAKESYLSALEHSRSDDMKSEGKYDTRAIEAGYLASAKKQRVDELQSELYALEKLSSGLSVTAPSKKIALGSLVLLESDEGRRWNFICPCSGPSVAIEGKNFFIVSVTSPLAKEMLGLEEGDGFELETPKGDKDYLVARIS